MRALNFGGRIDGASSVKLGGLQENRDELLGIDHLTIAACGTSLHAGLFGARVMRMLRSFKCAREGRGVALNSHCLPRVRAVCFLSHCPHCAADCVRGGCCRVGDVGFAPVRQRWFAGDLAVWRNQGRDARPSAGPGPRPARSVSGQRGGQHGGAHVQVRCVPQRRPRRYGSWGEGGGQRP